MKKQVRSGVGVRHGCARLVVSMGAEMPWFVTCRSLQNTPTHSHLLLQSQEALLIQQNGHAGPGWPLISGSRVRAPRRV